jgi:cobyrinic acid a,c-diamide synthase
MPVIGAVPKLDEQHFPERHLGLVPTPEHDWANKSIETISCIAEQYIDLDALISIAQKAPALKADVRAEKSEVGMGPSTSLSAVSSRSNGSAEPNAEIGSRKPVIADRKAMASSQQPEPGDQQPEASNQKPEASTQKPATRSEHPESSIGKPSVRIGIIRDSAFQFYYPENIDALAERGADIVYISPLKYKKLPDLDALYIGGGFPETHAEQLSANQEFNLQLKTLAEDGFPIYAECGGLMYLGEQLILENATYPMVGILPLSFDFYKRPQGHGYTIIKVEKENPYFDVGFEFRGHEFHYSRVSKWDSRKGELVFRMQRGAGIDKDRDGMLYKNVLATYTHIHALGTPGWAPALIRNAIIFKIKKNQKS